jgi:heat shock protein HslJ
MPSITNRIDARLREKDQTITITITITTLSRSGSRRNSVRRTRSMPLAASALAAAALAAVTAFTLTGCSAANQSPLIGATFTSISGHDDTGDLAWLGTEPLYVSFTTTNNQATIGVKTPCNSLSAPVRISQTLLTIDARQMTATLMGCSSPESEYEAWTTTFLETPLTYKLDGAQLTLSNPTDEVILREN